MTETSLDNYRDEVGVIIEEPITEWQKRSMPQIQKTLNPERELIKAATFVLNDKNEYGFVVLTFTHKENSQEFVGSPSFILPPTSSISFTQEQVNILGSGLIKKLKQYIDSSKLSPDLVNMQLTKITDPIAYLNFPLSRVYYQPLVALTFPPGMLAIAAAISAVSDKIADDEDLETDLEFLIDGYREELGELWEIKITAEVDYSDDSETFDVRVTRDANDYSVQILSVQILDEA